LITLLQEVLFIIIIPKFSAVSELLNDDDSEIYCNLDDEGYIYDDEGECVLDDNGNRVKLTAEQIEKFNNNNMIE